MFAMHTYKRDIQEKTHCIWVLSSYFTSGLKNLYFPSADLQLYKPTINILNVFFCFDVLQNLQVSGR